LKPVVSGRSRKTDKASARRPKGFHAIGVTYVRSYTRFPGGSSRAQRFACSAATRMPRYTIRSLLVLGCASFAIYQTSASKYEPDGRESIRSTRQAPERGHRTRASPEPANHRTGQGAILSALLSTSTEGTLSSATNSVEGLRIGLTNQTEAALASVTPVLQPDAAELENACTFQAPELSALSGTSSLMEDLSTGADSVAGTDNDSDRSEQMTRNKIRDRSWSLYRHLMDPPVASEVGVATPRLRRRIGPNPQAVGVNPLDSSGERNECRAMAPS